MKSYKIDTIKIEKEKAMRRYRNFQKIANFVRIVRVPIAIMLISFVFSWTPSWIPTVFEFSRVIFRRFSSIWPSTVFVFIIVVAAIITVLENASPSTAKNSDVPENNDVIFEFSPEVYELLEIPATEIVAAAVEIPAKEVATVAVEIPEKEVAAIAVEIPAAEVAAVAVEIPAAEVLAVETTVEREVTEKVYRKRSAKVLRRKSGSDLVSETETEADAKMNAKARSDEEEELSNEEFNRRIEEFIQKQRKFLREESKRF